MGVVSVADFKDQRLVTVEELAERLSVHPRTIQRLVERQEIRAVRVGRQFRFRREWIEEWIQRNTLNDEGTGSA